MAELLEIRAEYHGPPVMLYESFKQSDITVTAIHDDSSYDFIIQNSKITVSTVKMEVTPTQACTVKYIDPETRKVYTSTIEVPAIYPIKLTANYTGDYVYIIGDFDHSDVDVYIEYNYPDYNAKLDATQYKINSYSVASLGPNTFTVTEKVLRTNNISTTITVYGIRKIVAIRAKYIGDPVEITEEVDPANIKVEIETVNQFDEDRFTVDLTYGTEILSVGDDEFTRDFYIKESLVVNTVGGNTKTICYKDPLTQWEKRVTIPGTPKVVDFQANYIGKQLQEGAIVSPEDVEALATMLMDVTTNKLVTQTVEYGEWAFYDAPVVQAFNKGMIKLQYRKFITHVVVPYEIIETLRLRCWYEGAKIEVGERFRREDVFAYIVDERHHVTALTQYDLVFVGDAVVTEEGWNFFEVRTKNTAEKMSGTYAVPGYIPLHQEPERPFKVVYIDVKNNYAEHDCTKIFEDAMTIDDFLYIDWDTFQAVVTGTTRYGLYIVTAPRLHGLSNKYDEDWEVLCLHKHAIKANVMKTYYEEDESWQDRRHQQQTLSKWWKIPLQQQ